MRFIGTFIVDDWTSYDIVFEANEYLDILVQAYRAFFKERPDKISAQIALTQLRLEQPVLLTRSTPSLRVSYEVGDD
jgi:hypothetical protein